MHARRAEKTYLRQHDREQRVLAKASGKISRIRAIRARQGGNGGRERRSREEVGGREIESELPLSCLYGERVATACTVASVSDRYRRG